MVWSTCGPDFSGTCTGIVREIKTVNDAYLPRFSKYLEIKKKPPMGGGGGQFCDSADEDEFKGPYKKDDKVQGNLKSQLIELN